LSAIFQRLGINQKFDAYGNVIPIFAHRMLRGEPVIIFGDGEQPAISSMSATWRRPITRRPCPGGFRGLNVGSSTRITINRLVGTDDRRQRHSSRGPVWSRAKATCATAWPTCRRPKKAFGFNPSVKLEEGLKEYMDWAKIALV